MLTTCYREIETQKKDFKISACSLFLNSIPLIILRRFTLRVALLSQNNQLYFIFSNKRENFSISIGVLRYYSVGFPFRGGYDSRRTGNGSRSTWWRLKHCPWNCCELWLYYILFLWFSKKNSISFSYYQELNRLLLTNVFSFWLGYCEQYLWWWRYQSHIICWFKRRELISSELLCALNIFYVGCCVFKCKSMFFIPRSRVFLLYDSSGLSST